MINSYPVWKYFIVFFILIMGCIYAIPNLYTENFMVYIVNDKSKNQKFNCTLLNDIKKILKHENIVYKSVVLHKDCMQVLLFSKSDQLRVYKKLSSTFLEKNFIFYKRTSAMPNWLHFIKAKPMQLGLDLKGGLYLILRVDIITILNKFQEEYINTLRSILNEKNIPYVKIQKIKNYDIEIIFKHSSHKEQFVSCVSKIYPETLLFYIIDTCKVNITFTKNYITTICEDIIKKNSIILKHRMQQLKIFDPVIQRYGNDRIIIELPGVQDITEIKTMLSNTASLEFRLVNTKISTFDINNHLIPEDSEIKLDNKGNIVPLYKDIILTGDHIINSDIKFDEYHRPQVNIYLDNVGSTVISKFTKNHIGNLMATVFVEYKNSKQKDSQGYPILYKYDRVINVAMIQSQLLNNFYISGINNLTDARYLSSLLKMGSLYSPVYIEEERMIGPTLGQNNIIQGAIACGLGILLSICFMVIWYRCFGLIAGIALITNFILMISLMSLIPGIILTMSSIAGIVLTLSVAIDANVLINERIKEEIKQGKPMQYAIYMGYRKAFNSIIDANITTIMTSIILYIMGTGPMQGFAIATIIGVGTSMFTSIIGTRVLVNLIYGKKRINKLSI